MRKRGEMNAALYRIELNRFNVPGLTFLSSGDFSWPLKKYNEIENASKGKSENI
jgi:hypothetical protein